ncbi:MAG: ribokinase [Bacteroidetes bacterium]|nr:ribokinase [Bacteroidota bacterium]
MNLVVIGSSNMDLVIYLPRIPAVGETILGGKSSTVFGGKGANQAVAASRAGGNICFISKIGKDIFGENMLSHFENEGFNTDFILYDEDEPTGIAQIFVSEKGENSIAVAPGANMSLSVSDIRLFEKTISEAEYVLVQLEIPLETIITIVDIAHQHNTRVIINPAPAQTLPDELLSKTWLLTPNESETEILTGEKLSDIGSVRVAAKKLLEKGIQNIIVTLGEKGCLLCNENGHQHFSAYKEKAIDTTAAGDVFNGSLAVALANENPFEQAIQFASAAAAISVTRKGAQPSVPNLTEIVEYMATK